MRFARVAFFIAAMYGLAVMLVMYFMESRFAHGDANRVSNPEFYYGFVGVATAWQVAFLMIALDPHRYQLIMLAACLEKFSYALATIALYLGQRVDQMILMTGIIDLAFGIVFVVAFLRTSQQRELARMAMHPDRSAVSESAGPLI